MILNVMLDAAAGGSQSLLMIGMIVLVMYFFLFRPQIKRQKEEKKFREEISKGMRIVTTSGIHGKILDLQETTITIESENSRLKLDKSAISKELSAAYYGNKDKDTKK